MVAVTYYMALASIILTVFSGAFPFPIFSSSHYWVIDCPARGKNDNILMAWKWGYFGVKMSSRVYLIPHKRIFEPFKIAKD